MWVRSQRKNALVNINFLRVINDGNYCLICGATTDGCDYELGVYSTEEKALKVMDELQEEAWVEKKSYVYQMPSDDEVVTVKKRVDYIKYRELEEKREDSNEEDDF